MSAHLSLSLYSYIYIHIYVHLHIPGYIPIQSHAFPPRIKEIPWGDLLLPPRKALRLRDGWPVISVGAISGDFGNLETIK